MPDETLAPVEVARPAKPLRRLFAYLWHAPGRIAAVVALSFVGALLGPVGPRPAVSSTPSMKMFISPVKALRVAGVRFSELSREAAAPNLEEVAGERV